jgi:hypothetical protein
LWIRARRWARGRREWWRSVRKIKCEFFIPQNKLIIYRNKYINAIHLIDALLWDEEEAERERAMWWLRWEKMVEDGLEGDGEVEEEKETEMEDVSLIDCE